MKLISEKTQQSIRRKGIVIKSPREHTVKTSEPPKTRRTASNQGTFGFSLASEVQVSLTSEIPDYIQNRGSVEDCPRLHMESVSQRIAFQNIQN